MVLLYDVIYWSGLLCHNLFYVYSRILQSLFHSSNGLLLYDCISKAMNEGTREYIFEWNRFNASLCCLAVLPVSWIVAAHPLSHFLCEKYLFYTWCWLFHQRVGLYEQCSTRIIISIFWLFKKKKKAYMRNNDCCINKPKVWKPSMTLYCMSFLYLLL